MTPRGLAIGPYTLVSALGAGLGPTSAALAGGVSGLVPQAATQPAMPACAIGPVADVDQMTLPAALAAYSCRNNQLALAALFADGFAATVTRLAQRIGAGRIGVVVGTSTSGIATTEAAYRQGLDADGRLPPGFPYRQTHNVFSVGDFTRRVLKTTGPAMVVSTACSSSAKAFGTAARLITGGVCSAVVVGGVDSLCATTLYGFGALGLLAPDRCRPFSADRDGISLGEAAGFALLASADLIDDTGLWLTGVGDSADAYHMTAPHPEGRGAQRAMAQALAMAAIPASRLDYIHLHGTGTPLNDAAEDLAITAIGAHQVPASSTKGATGHTLGAAGICAVVLTALAMRAQRVPGTVNTQVVDPRFQGRILTQAAPQPVHRALINTFGFGGSNCSLVIEDRL